MACFRGSRDDFYGEVLLLDETKLQLTAERGVKKSTKGAAILDQVFAHLGLSEVRFFGLRFCDAGQQTRWLDPTRTLSQHRGLLGPPYIFYFGVRFYAEDPAELEDEAARDQFYLQLRQDMCRGRLPVTSDLRSRLQALMMLADGGDQVQVELENLDETLKWNHLVARRLFLSHCSSLQMYGADLFAAYGENQSEYFLGPTPVGVVIYKNKELVGKYFWQRISKLHFRERTFELRVAGKRNSETSFFFHTSDRSHGKRLWRSCVEHHTFYRMSKLRAGMDMRKDSVKKKSTVVIKHKCLGSPTSGPASSPPANRTQDAVAEPVRVRTAPAATPRLDATGPGGGAEPSAPWENGGSVSGLFKASPAFRPISLQEEPRGGGAHGRSRSLDGELPIRRQRRRCRSHGNNSSGSESEKAVNIGERRRRRSGKRTNQKPDSIPRSNSRSPNAQIWKHIQKQLVDPDTLIDREMEEIPYKEVRVPAEPIRTRPSPRGRRHRKSASASELQTKLVPPLPVTTATDTSPKGPEAVAAVNALRY